MLAGTASQISPHAVSVWLTLDDVGSGVMAADSLGDGEGNAAEGPGLPLDGDIVVGGGAGVPPAEPQAATVSRTATATTADATRVIGRRSADGDGASLDG